MFSEAEVPRIVTCYGGDAPLRRDSSPLPDWCQASHAPCAHMQLSRVASADEQQRSARRNDHASGLKESVRAVIQFDRPALCYVVRIPIPTRQRGLSSRTRA